MADPVCNLTCVSRMAQLLSIMTEIQEQLHHQEAMLKETVTELRILKARRKR